MMIRRKRRRDYIKLTRLISEYHKKIRPNSSAIRNIPSISVGFVGFFFYIYFSGLV